MAEELHYLSQQGAGNIIVSKGIKATASLLIEKSGKTNVIHTYTAHLRSLNCKFPGVFRKQACLFTVEREHDSAYTWLLG